MQKGGATNSATNVLSKLWRRLMFDGKDMSIAKQRLYLCHRNMYTDLHIKLSSFDGYENH